MKLHLNNSILAFLFLFSPLISFSQWTVIDSSYLRVDYTYHYRPYANDTMIMKEPVVLLVGDTWLHYTNAKSHEVDKIIKMPGKGQMNFTAMGASTSHLPKSKTHHFNVYRKKASDTLYVRHSGFPLYQCKENPLDFNWKIADERKEIAGYQCVQATGEFRGRAYIAWFAPEIPILAGPYKFGGLPGLIVEIADTENHHVFKLDDISEYEGPLIKSYTHEYKPYGKWVAKLIKSYKVGVQNGYGLVQGKLKNKIVPNTPEMREKYLRKSSVLNPIELVTKK